MPRPFADAGRAIAIQFRFPPTWKRLLTYHCKMQKSPITVDPQIQGGVPVFAGTRVPVKNLFDYLEAGEPLDLFLDDFPSVARDVAVAVLEQAREAVTPHAHPA